MIYLDTSASYPVLPEVREALIAASDLCYANSAASHLLADRVSQNIESVRSVLADMIGSYSSEVVFTSGATESNNIAFKSLLLADGFPPDKNHIVTTSIEHKCVLSICGYLQRRGFSVTYLKPDSNGIISVEKVEAALQTSTAMVSVMHVNNELGTINPIAEIGELCSRRGVLFHSDAAQSFGKIPVDVDDCNCDLLSISAHKIGGPKGVGAIYIRDLRKLELEPVIHGAGQEEGLRGGTVASPLVVGFGEAAKYFPMHYHEFERTRAKDYLLGQLAEVGIAYRVNGGGDSLPNCVSLTLGETDVGSLLRDNESQICLAQGSACSSREIEASHVLTALGLSRDLAGKTLRISFPLNITLTQLDQLIEAIKKASVSNLDRRYL
ncbi:cysteine desulfurase [Halieaceae bacterium IMCC8485]|uniref:cysteine desulfurase n=1 Tax=Candidatus Seongchinamella marina TaxID=2518990 RepID=A0ABT3T2H7_9GAMM|nr:cysteine desulfurase family protein [Candidatus Seongchinamella marina]MCX2975722.1 cysteine desulfurase [Candidatus Seongchinamella marina]